MTQALLNGLVTPHGTNGVNGFVGKGKLAPAAQEPEAVYEDDVNPKYLDGYSYEEIVKARPISDAYDGIILPPYARPTPINTRSFRTGHKPTIDELASEIRVTYEGQIPFAEILDRIVQDAYGNLNELAEVMPSFSDHERKRKLIEYAVATRKQIIKVYAISKWARVADDVQKALNILSFLTRSEQKITASRLILGSVAAVLIPSKRRNADLITALDVLSTGAYRKLPSILRETFEDYEPITDDQVISTLQALDDVILYRLRFSEIVPVAMADYRIANGRVWFTVPERFEVALTITGPEETDYWYALDMKFLVGAGGEGAEALEDFPSDPHPWLKAQIIAHLNQQLALNSDLELDIGDPFEDRPKREMRDRNKINTPLIRAYNMLQMLSLTYQLEILHHQGLRTLKLGWQEFLTISMDMPSRRSFSVVYWKRSPPSTAQPGRPDPPDPVPAHGGTITFSIVANPPAKSSTSTSSIHVNRILTQLESKLKSASDDISADRMPTDEVELASLRVEWQPAHNALQIPVPSEEIQLDLIVNPLELDFPSILRSLTRMHSRAILRTIQGQLLGPGQKSIFTHPSEVELTQDDATGYALRVHLCGSQTVIVSVDERTGRILLKDVGVFAASNRSGRFLSYAHYLNRHPSLLLRILKTLKFEMILAEIEHQVMYLGLQSTKQLAIPPSELTRKFGNIRVSIYIHLGPFPDYYLAMLGTEEGLKWALVNVEDVTDEPYRMRSIKDFGWLDTEHIGGAGERRRRWSAMAGGGEGDARVRGSEDDHHLTIKTEMLRELYAFCCARVSHTKVEQQLKTRGIPWTSVFSSSTAQASSSPSNVKIPATSTSRDRTMDVSPLTPFSPTARSVPKICIRIGDIIRSEAANNVAYENVKIKVVDWWSERPCRVITSVRLRDIQPVSDASKNGMEGGGQALDPSRNITYDDATSIVSFISYDINTCVNEFLEEWERVQRVAGIVREVGQVKTKRRWDDIRILSFNLQRVEFIYHSVYAVAIQWVHQAVDSATAQGLYEMDFTIAGSEDSTQNGLSNPHQDVAAFVSRKLQADAARSISFAVEALIMVLRDSLPLLLSLQRIKQESPGRFTLFVKTETWYRLMLGYKHALDFRILPNSRVAIADVAASLFMQRKIPDTPPTAPYVSFAARIPGFQDVVQTISRECAPTSSAFPPIADVGDGLVCEGNIVAEVVPKLCAALASRIWSS